MDLAVDPLPPVVAVPAIDDPAPEPGDPVAVARQVALWDQVMVGVSSSRASPQVRFFGRCCLHPRRGAAERSARSGRV